MKIEDLATGLAYVTISTPDLDETILFYNELGFDITQLCQDPATNERVAFLSLGNLTLKACEKADLTITSPQAISISIFVTDLEACFDTISKHALNNLDDEIHVSPYGEKGLRCFSIEGPSKERVEFCQLL